MEKLPSPPTTPSPQPSTSKQSLEKQPEWAEWTEWKTDFSAAKTQPDFAIQTIESSDEEIIGAEKSQSEIQLSPRSEFAPVFGVKPKGRSIEEINADATLTDKEKRTKRKRKLRRERMLQATGKIREVEIKYNELQEWIAKRSNPNKVFNLSSLNFASRIFAAYEEFKKKGLKVCGLSLEKAQIYVRQGNDESKQLPIWISVVDMDANTSFNEVCRYPKNAIKDLGTEFHGLTWEEIKKADHYCQVRKRLIPILMSYDIIAVAGGVNDFTSMGFTRNEWDLIRPKIRDVTHYYEYRQTQIALDLKFIIFSLFGKVIQDGEHSPVIDAGFTLFAYMTDHERFERIHQNAINGPEYEKPYPQIKYPKNGQMSGLIKRIMNAINDWPTELLQPIRRACEWKPSYDPTEHCPVEELQPPYSEVKKEVFQIFIDLT